MSFRAAFFAGVLLLVPLAVPAAPTVDESKVIYPKAVPADAPSGAAGGSLNSTTTLLGALILAGGGGWLLFRKRAAQLSGRAATSLTIAETKPLGNRQYLVVASYEGKKFLLGVCPGRIDLLSPLEGGESPVKSAR